VAALPRPAVSIVPDAVGSNAAAGIVVKVAGPRRRRPVSAAHFLKNSAAIFQGHMVRGLWPVMRPRRASTLPWPVDRSEHRGASGAMAKSKGRTGAHARANIQPPPTQVELEAAKHEVAQIEGRLAGLASGHPSVKIWKARLRLAQSVIARAPSD